MPNDSNSSADIPRVLESCSLSNIEFIFVLNSSKAMSALTSCAYNRPCVMIGSLTAVICPLDKSTSKASPKEWAGSVLTINTFHCGCDAAISIAIAADVVVFPTPPFPPTNIVCCCLSNDDFSYWSSNDLIKGLILLSDDDDDDDILHQLWWLYFA